MCPHREPRSWSIDNVSDFSAHSESLPQNRGQPIRIDFFVQAQCETHRSKLGVDFAFGEIHTKEPARGLVELRSRFHWFDLKASRPELLVTLFRDIGPSDLVSVYEVALYLALKLDVGLRDTFCRSTETYVAVRQFTSRYPTVRRKERVLIARKHSGHSMYLDSVHA